MARLEDFLNKSKQQSDTNADGSFSCQECNVIVTSAVFNEDERIIKWVCPEGHISQVRL